MEQLELGNISIEVEQKDIKNIHLSVYPPYGRVRIAAPSKMKMDTIRVFVISKLPWIKKQQESLLAQERESPREFINRESHYFLGKRYLLKLIENDEPPKVEIDHKYIHLYIRNGTDQTKRKEILESWYRMELKKIVPDLIEKWEKKIGVQSNEYRIKRMKTKWGTCNTEAKRIWLNLELARKPVECLEYIIVHELVHLLERSHNARFIKYMDEFMPKWRFYRDELNRLPYSHVDWGY
ncbi:M48 family metallopeptidase [Algoriphagus machipongonensis]|uniref:Phosphonate metabolism protein PhnI n=1 Tax=Algoriphagus machipongonensis TaxID=388413 RepID=A3HT82_9BACT|nr:SprT family zinc-dependent metalloprotease [Algoriphagus machipongonensis]EAZ83050.1 phosphonate metabolism protein PhnI [Algoriphagus machipongonensis]